MNETFMENFDFPSYNLQKENLNWLDDKTLVVRKWNWDYQLAWDFQKKSVFLLQDFPKIKVLICCSHPRLFTNGRGLQKPKKGEVLELKNFEPELIKLLPFPFYQIERGGGLTFHHPGQFVFYPIVKLNPTTLSLSKLMDTIFGCAAEVLESWGIDDADSSRKLLGLWLGHQKIASMGIAIERLTTFHGMALNVFRDEEMSRALKALNPCGLTSETYTSAEDHAILLPEALNIFCDQFLRRLQYGWQ